MSLPLFSSFPAAAVVLHQRMNSSRFCVNSDSVVMFLRSGYLAHLFVPCLFEMISRSKSWVGLLSRSAEEGGKGAFEKGSIGKVRWLSGKGEDSKPE